jgi:transposase
MGKSYSLDLRERVIDFVGCGGSRRQATSHFSVSPSFAVKLWRHREKTGSLAPAKQGRPSALCVRLNARCSKQAFAAWPTNGG